MLRIAKRHLLTSPLYKQLQLGPIIPPAVRISYIRPIATGLTACTTIFFTAAVIHEREKETFWHRLKTRTADGAKWTTMRDVITDDKLFLADLWAEKKKLWLEKKERVMEDLKKRLEQYQRVPIEVKRAFLAVAQAYLSMNEAEKTMVGLIGVNLIVFAVWRVPGLKPFMMRNFTHSPLSNRYLTLVSSFFSHRSAVHLVFTSVGLWVLGPFIHDVLGREQFVATYISLGIGSNVASHVTRLAMRSSRPPAVTLGSTGALYGLLAAAVVSYPDSNVFIPFLPTTPIKLNHTLPALVGLDIVGILSGWSSFDIYGHLGGMTLGFAYMKVGPTYIWPNLLQTVRNIKERGAGNDGGEKPSSTLMEIPKKIREKYFGKKVVAPEVEQ